MLLETSAANPKEIAKVSIDNAKNIIAFRRKFISDLFLKINILGLLSVRPKCIAFAVLKDDARETGAINTMLMVNIAMRCLSGIDSKPKGKISLTPSKRNDGTIAQKIVALTNPAKIEVQ